MSDKFFTSNFNAKEVTKFLSEQAEKMGDLTPLMKLARKKLRDYVMENFHTEGTASGDKWASLSDEYKKQKMKAGKGDKKLLHYNDDLSTKLLVKSDKNSAMVGSALVYAAMMNYGWNDYIKRRSKKGNTRYKLRIPERPFMRLGQTQLEDLLAELTIGAEEIIMNQEALKRAYGT